MPRHIFICNSCGNDLYLFSSNRNDLNNTRSSSGSGKPLRNFVTECQHVFCQNCYHKCVPKCPVCAKTCRLLEISDAMPFHIRAMFEISSNIFEMYKGVIYFQNKQDKYRWRRMKEVEHFYLKKYDSDKEKIIGIQQKYEEETIRRKKLVVLHKRIADFRKEQAKRSQCTQKSYQGESCWEHPISSLKPFQSNASNNFSFDFNFKPRATSTPYSTDSGIFTRNI